LVRVRKKAALAAFRKGLRALLPSIAPLLAALLLSPAFLSAQDRPQEEAVAWSDELQRIGRQLAVEEYEAAEAASLELAWKFADQIVGGQGAEMLLAITSTYRALAVAGQGRGEEAIWHWQVAQQLFPQVEQLDLSQFGAMAGFLRMHPPRERRSGGEAERQGTFVPPARRDSPPPEFPDGRAFRGLQVDVTVQVVVGVDGRPREPVLVESSGEPSLVWSALEALLNWRFEPGRRDGEPEPSLYTLTVSFVVPRE
jgi:TonB family protein